MGIRGNDLLPIVPGTFFKFWHCKNGWGIVSKKKKKKKCETICNEAKYLEMSEKSIILDTIRSSCRKRSFLTRTENISISIHHRFSLVSRKVKLNSRFVKLFSITKVFLFPSIVNFSLLHSARLRNVNSYIECENSTKLILAVRSSFPEINLSVSKQRETRN